MAYTPVLIGSLIALWQLTGNRGDSPTARFVLGAGALAVGFVLTTERVVAAARAAKAEPAEPTDTPDLRSPSRLDPALNSYPGGPGYASAWVRELTVTTPTSRHSFPWWAIQEWYVASDGMVSLRLSPTAGAGYRIEIDAGERGESWRKILEERASAKETPRD